MNEKNSKDTLHMQSAFSFECDRCSLCCTNKLIQINPYEILRLASGLGITTTEFIRKYTQDGGVHLLQKENGTCFFQDGSGCRVHADRPFVCRLYPLGRHGDEDGSEHFFLLTLDESCRRNLGKQSTVQEYLQDQGAMDYYRATLCYLELFSLLAGKYQEEIRGYLSSANPENSGAKISGKGIPDLMDIDLTLNSNIDYDSKHLPEEPWEKTLLHVRIIEQWMDNELKGDT